MMWFLASALGVSCSIKEDRSVCPCIINLDYGLVNSDRRFHNGKDTMLVLIGEQYSSLERPCDYPDNHSVTVARINTGVDCYCGMTRSRLDGTHSLLVIPKGEDADPLFSFHEDVFFDGFTEEYTVTPRMGNECTKVIVTFRDEDMDTSLGDRILRVTGTTCGLDLRSGLPIAGEFLCDMKIFDNKSYSFNMPRQQSKDISIDVLSSETGNSMFRINLANELELAGFGWNDESLPPVVVLYVDTRNIIVDVRIIDWDESVYFNYYL